MSFEIDDEVQIIGGWNRKDYQCNFSNDVMEDFINDGITYTIQDSHTLDDGTIYLLNNGYWWYAHCLKHQWDCSPVNKYIKVINKINKLKQRRKELGYAF